MVIQVRNSWGVICRHFEISVKGINDVLLRVGDACKNEYNLVYKISAPIAYIGCFNIFVERRLRAVGYKSYGIVRQT
jgi:hypothetical protein